MAAKVFAVEKAAIVYVKVEAAESAADLVVESAVLR
jgi:hypothetical protein